MCSRQISAITKSLSLWEICQCNWAQINAVQSIEHKALTVSSIKHKALTVSSMDELQKLHLCHERKITFKQAFFCKGMSDENTPLKQLKDQEEFSALVNWALNFWKYKKTKTNAYTMLCHKKHVILSSCNVFVHAMSTQSMGHFRTKSNEWGNNNANALATLWPNRPFCGQWKKQGTLWPMKETRHFVANERNKALCGQWKK